MDGSTRLRVTNFLISLDGYGAGPEESLENPFGVDGEDLQHLDVRDPSGPGDAADRAR
jgi:hypothetical protein